MLQGCNRGICFQVSYLVPKHNPSTPKPIAMLPLHHPLAPSGEHALALQFSERIYWDKRYQQDPTTFEWYRSYDSLKPVLTR